MRRERDRARPLPWRPSSPRHAPLLCRTHRSRGSLALLGATAPRARRRRRSAARSCRSIPRSRSPAPRSRSSTTARRSSPPTSASGDGAFYLDAPAAGAYRLVVLVAGASFVSPRREARQRARRSRSSSPSPTSPSTFAVGAVRARRHDARHRRCPAVRARPIPPASPSRATRALVSTMFVVDEDGPPERRQLPRAQHAPRIRSSSRSATRSSAHASCPRRRTAGRCAGRAVHLRLRPARRSGARRRRRASCRRRRAPRVRAEGGGARKTLYVIGADELSAPGIEQMNLVDALNRLRPKLFGPTRLDEQHHAGRTAGLRQRRARRGPRIPARHHRRPASRKSATGSARKRR